MKTFDFKDALVKIADLKEATYNPRRISEEELNKLEASIDGFGFIEPLVVNTHEGRENVVICGHQRLKIAKRKGAKEIRAVLVDLPLGKEMQLNIASNKIGGEFDFGKLADMFENLEKMKEDMQATGFAGEDIRQIVENYSSYQDRKQKADKIRENLEKAGINADEAEAIGDVIEHAKEIASEDIENVDICGEVKVRKMIVFWYDAKDEAIYEQHREIFSTGRDIEQDTDKLRRIVDETNAGDTEKLKAITAWYYNEYLPKNGKTLKE